MAAGDPTEPAPSNSKPSRRRRWGWWLSVLLLVYAMASWTGAWILTRPWPSAGLSGAGWQPSRVTTSDGITLHTYRRGPENGPLVVLGHGYHGSARQVRRFGELLANAGWTVLAYDHRGHGQSEGALTTAGAREGLDVDAVLADVRRRRGSLAEVRFVGISMSAAAAVFSEQSRDLHALVLVGCYDSLQHAYDQRWRYYAGFHPAPLDLLLRQFLEWRTGLDMATVRPIDALADRHTPTLLIHGRQDLRVGLEAPELMRQAAGGPVQLYWHPGDHRDLGRLHEQPMARAILDYLGDPKHGSTRSRPDDE